MQRELLTKKHIRFLKEQFDLTEDQFAELCERDFDDPDFRAFFDELTWKECDASDEYKKNGEYSENGLCAIELINIICGPYDSEDE